MAAQGYLEIRQDSLSKYLILKNGYCYEGDPGNSDYKVTQFETFSIKLSPPPEAVKEKSTQGMAFWELFKLDNLNDVAELQWQFPISLMVTIIALLGIPLSRVNQDKGGFIL